MKRYLILFSLVIGTLSAFLVNEGAKKDETTLLGDFFAEECAENDRIIMTFDDPMSFPWEASDYETWTLFENSEIETMFGDDPFMPSSTKSAFALQ